MPRNKEPARYVIDRQGDAPRPRNDRGSNDMNKQELIDSIAAQTDASKTQTGEILDAVIEAIRNAVTEVDTAHVNRTKHGTP